MLNKIGILKFFRQVKQEVKKISWLPTKELLIAVIVILSAVSIFSVFSLIVDYAIYNVIDFILNLGS